MTQIEFICRVAQCAPTDLRSLRTLYAFGECGITDAGLKCVPNLKTLFAFDNAGITDCGLNFLPNLKTLDASGKSGITDFGLDFLPKLTTLYAGGNDKITAGGLVRFPHLSVPDVAEGGGSDVSDASSIWCNCYGANDTIHTLAPPAIAVKSIASKDCARNSNRQSDRASWSLLRRAGRGLQLVENRISRLFRLPSRQRA